MLKLYTSAKKKSPQVRPKTKIPVLRSSGIRIWPDMHVLPLSACWLLDSVADNDSASERTKWRGRRQNAMWGGNITLTAINLDSVDSDDELKVRWMKWHPVAAHPTVFTSLCQWRVTVCSKAVRNLPLVNPLLDSRSRIWPMKPQGSASLFSYVDVGIKVQGKKQLDKNTFHRLDRLFPQWHHSLALLILDITKHSSSLQLSSVAVSTDQPSD